MYHKLLNRHWLVLTASLFILFFNLAALAADSTSSTGTTTPDLTSPADKTPAPYTADEFPDWMHKLRRAEIISIGTIPLTFIFSYLAYDLIRFGVHKGAAEYNPFAANHQPYTTAEDVGVVITACSISVCVALIDYWIGEVQAKKEKKNKEKILNASY